MQISSGQHFYLKRRVGGGKLHWCLDRKVISERWKKLPLKGMKEKTLEGKKKKRREKEDRGRKAILKVGIRLQIALQWQQCNLFIPGFNTSEILNKARAKWSCYKKKNYLISTEKGPNIANISSCCLLHYIQSEYIKSYYYYHYFIWITIAPIVQGIISRDSISGSEDSESKIASIICRTNGRILRHFLSYSKYQLLPPAIYLAKKTPKRPILFFR